MCGAYFPYFQETVIHRGFRPVLQLKEHTSKEFIKMIKQGFNVTKQMQT